MSSYCPCLHPTSQSLFKKIKDSKCQYADGTTLDLIKIPKAYSQNGKYFNYMQHSGGYVCFNFPPAQKQDSSGFTGGQTKTILDPVS
jgi:hypothetical protein